MNIINVKVCYITPTDKYHLQDKKAMLICDSLAVGSAMMMEFEEGGSLRTSKIESIYEDEATIEVKTKNSIYKLNIIKEETKDGR